MPVVREQDVQKLLDQVSSLLKSLKEKRKPEEEPHPADPFVMPEFLRIQKDLQLDADLKLPTGVWDKLPQEVADSIYQKVMSIVERLTKALVPDPDGPTDRASIMYYEHASNTVIWLVFVGAIVLAGLDLHQIALRWEQATHIPPPKVSVAGPPSAGTPQEAPVKSDEEPTRGSGSAGSPPTTQSDSPKAVVPSPSNSRQSAPAIDDKSESVGNLLAKCEKLDCPPTQRDVLIMVILMGTLGGLLRLVSSFAKYIGNRQLLRSWIPYYIVMPIEGGALAPLIYLLLRVGLLSPTASTNDAGSLNVFGVYAIAGLTGLFSSQAMEKLAEVFAVIFNKVQAKDSIESKGQAKATAVAGSAKHQ
jgi:hypothetical protein